MSTPSRNMGGFGKYRARCEPGFCAADAGSGTSKIERDIREMFKLVLGPTMPENVAPGFDMAFEVPVGQLILIEYDGAGWHKGHEQRDLRKAQRLETDHIIVIRIREHPLQPLRSHDVWVPARSTAQTCVQLTLHHLSHITDPDEQRRIAEFLASLPKPPEREQLPCPACWRAACEIERSKRAHKWDF
jgi:hypothetical protein